MKDDARLKVVVVVLLVMLIFSFINFGGRLLDANARITILENKIADMELDAMLYMPPQAPVTPVSTPTPVPAYNLPTDELLRVVALEGGYEYWNCLAVATVIYNRIRAGFNGRYTLHDVINDPGQFCVQSTRKVYLDNPDLYRACFDAANGTVCLSYNVLYFCTDDFYAKYHGTSKWRYVEVNRYGGNVFCIDPYSDY